MGCPTWSRCQCRPALDARESYLRALRQDAPRLTLTFHATSSRKDAHRSTVGRPLGTGSGPPSTARYLTLGRLEIASPGASWRVVFRPNGPQTLFLAGGGPFPSFSTANKSFPKAVYGPHQVTPGLLDDTTPARPDLGVSHLRRARGPRGRGGELPTTSKGRARVRFASPVTALAGRSAIRPTVADRPASKNRVTSGLAPWAPAVFRFPGVGGGHAFVPPGQ